MSDLHSDFSTHKNNGPLLNSRDYYRSNSPYKIYGPLQSIRITADPIRHKKSTDYSKHYGFTHVQFVIKIIFLLQ